MILSTPLIRDAYNWQQSFASAIRSPETLFDYLNLPSEHLPAAKQAHNDFPLCVPYEFASKMEKGNIDDPLLKQVLPIGSELVHNEGFTMDAVGDTHATSTPGLIQKYRRRALIISTSSCAIHCRFCFRRHFPYQKNSLNNKQINHIFAKVEQDSSINELILSGGDPLSLNNDRLDLLMNRINDVEQITLLRFHTRLPVVIPQRINEGFIKILRASNKKIVFVVHVNHPNEIDHKFNIAIKKLVQNHITLLNQSVLLKGINDSAEILCRLSHKLFAAGILPYYLHLMDKVQGTAHFDLPEQTAVQITHKMQAELPGYLVPKLVRETRGQASKTTINLMNEN